MKKNQKKPPRRNDEFYGTRYSIPVLCWNKKHVLNNKLVCWNYDDEGWVDADLSEGPSPEDYDIDVSTWTIPPDLNDGVVKEMPGKFKVRDTGASTPDDLVSRILNGVWLLSAKREMQHGEFEKFRTSNGLTKRTGVYIMAVAKDFLDKNGMDVPELAHFKNWYIKSIVYKAALRYINARTWREIRNTK